MAILEEDVARVRDSTDLVAVASEHLALKKVGVRHVGLCPFHAEKTASFSIDPDGKLYYCFGCGAGGDAISFLRQVEHLDFVEALEKLAVRAGITLRRDDARADAARSRRAELVRALEQAVDWYHQRLLAAPDAAEARRYLRAERGYDGDVVRAFKIGWAPEGWDTLAKALRLSDSVLTETGLGFVNQRGRQQDGFRGRVMFPIFDSSGAAIAFGGRSLSGLPKYRNSPETQLYSKRRTLYGLNWARRDVVNAGEVIVCEGYTDVIGFSLAGVPRAVATCGTALADEHFALLKNFARRVVLAFDADAAGQNAAERFYEWERRYEVDIAVAALPAGEDPAALARSDPEVLRRAVEQAKPFLAFRLERLLASVPLATGSAETRARTAQQALAMVAEHPTDLVRDQYVMHIADRCRLDPQPLRSLLESIRRQTSAQGRGATGGGDRPPPRDPPAPSTGSRGSVIEVAALRLAVHRPEEVATRLEEVLFDDEVHRQVFRALASADTLPEAVERAEPDAGRLLLQLATDGGNGRDGPGDGRDEGGAQGDVDEADEVLARLAKQAATRALAALEADLRLAPERFAELAPVTAWLKLTCELVEDPSRRRDAADQLIAWLAQRGGES